MTWRQLRNYLKGKLFLIGLTFIDEDGEVIELYQTHGKVARLTVDGFFKILREDQSIFTIPYDKDAIKIAKEGAYREKSTGETIENPDFIMTWKVKTTDQTDLDEIKKHGYFPVFEYPASKNVRKSESE